MPNGAAVYCRISSDPSEARLGVARQEADCRALASAKGWPVSAVFVDNDVSAASGKQRPAYADLLAALEAGQVDAVITWDADRLHRRPIELEEFFTVCDKAGVRHLATVGGDVDLASGEGVLVARIKGAVAAEEVRKVQQRSKRKKDELAAAGAPSGGGRRPFGFAEDRITHNPTEAEAIRSAAARVIAGETLHSIVRDWNEHGPAPVHGGIWRSNALHKFLTAPRTAGLRQHRGVVVGEAAWEPILDRRTWEQVRAILTDPARRTNADGRTHLLSGGIARCALCGARLVGKPRAPGVPAYACLPASGGCGRCQIVALPVEELVVGAVLDAFDSPEFLDRLAGQSRDESLDEVTAHLAELEARMTELAEVWASGEISRAEWLVARQAVEAQIEADRRQLSVSAKTARLNQYSGRGQLREAWPAMSIEQQRAALRMAIDRVLISPPAVRGRNIFDVDRVQIIWKV